MQIWIDFPNNSKSLDFKGPKLGTEQKSQKMREFGVCEYLGNVVKLLFWDRVTNLITVYGTIDTCLIPQFEVFQRR